MGETIPLDEYRKVALQTASYGPIDGISYLYPAVGMIGELGEATDCIKKLWRDSDGVLDHGSRYNLVMELGDAFWFVVAMEAEFGVMIDQRSDTSGEPEHPVISVLRINEMSGAISKIVRIIYTGALDRSEKNIELVRKEIAKHLGGIFHCLSNLAAFIDVPVEEILAANIQKLKYRVKTGSLAGNSNYR